MASGMICEDCGMPNYLGHICEAIVPDIKVERQLSHATCWASVVAAVGNASPGAVIQTPAMLIVAQGIPPVTFAPVNDIANEKYLAARSAALEKNALAPPKLDKHGKLKESRDAALMLPEYYPKIVCETVKDMSQAETTIAAKIKKSILDKKPVLIILKHLYTPLEGLSPEDKLMLNKITHVVLCTGIHYEKEKIISLTLQDPARDEITFTAKYSDLRNGLFRYITEDKIGLQTLKLVKKEHVNTQLHRVIFVV